jgi:hypothetical protein
VDDGADLVGERDPRQPLLAGAEAATEAEPEERELLGERAAGGVEDHGRAEVRHPHAGCLRRCGRRLPRHRHLGEEALACGARLRADGVGAVAVDADPGGRQQRGGSRVHRRDGPGDEVRPVDPAPAEHLLAGVGPPLVADAGRREVHDGIHPGEAGGVDRPGRGVPLHGPGTAG